MKVGQVGRMLDTRPAQPLLAALEARANWRPDRLSVLTYHRIDDVVDDGRYPGLISATPSDFAEQIAFLADRYSIVSIERVLGALRGHALPERPVLLTFDDAVSDFERNALPVLVAHDAPAVVFVPTGFVGDQHRLFWWDAIHAALSMTLEEAIDVPPLGTLALSSDGERRRAYGMLRNHCLALPSTEAAELAQTICDRLSVEPPPADVMSWTSLRALQDAGIACCPHSRTHAHLDQLDQHALDDEIQGSYHDLTEHLGATAPVFAYPAGRLTHDVVAAVRRAGIEAAFTTERGTNRLWDADPMRLSRLNVSRNSGLSAVRLQMLPAADRARSLGARRFR